MAPSQRIFVPAAGRDWLLPFYDPLTKWLGVDQARRELVAQAALQPLHRVLEVGCGTGTLGILIKSLHPSVQVTGLDPDTKALARARRKADRAGVSLEWDHGYADALPYADGAFDRVFSSMMFHHLRPDGKAKALLEVRRVLRPGGRLQMLDFVVPAHPARGGVGRWFHTHDLMRDNSEQRVLGLMVEAGLASASKLAERRIVFGTLAYYQASRPL